MQFRPNDLPAMEKGETRRVTVNISGASGSNNISGTPTATCERLTIGTVTTSGLDISFPVTADDIGTHNIIVSCDLTSAETLKGMIRAKVVDSTRECPRDDYG